MNDIDMTQETSSGGSWDTENGYAVMFIEGADGYLYTTVINKKGEKMFGPKTGFNPAYMSGDGK